MTSETSENVATRDCKTFYEMMSDSTVSVEQLDALFAGLLFCVANKGDDSTRWLWDAICIAWPRIRAYRSMYGI